MTIRCNDPCTHHRRPTPGRNTSGTVRTTVAALVGVILLAACAAPPNLPAPDAQTGCDPSDPCAALRVEASLPSQLQPGVPTPIEIRASYDAEASALADGAGIAIEIVAAGGTVSPARGTTDASGTFTTLATLDSGESELRLDITARDPGTGATASSSASSTAAAAGHVVPVEREAFANALVWTKVENEVEHRIKTTDPSQASFVANVSATTGDGGKDDAGQPWSLTLTTATDHTTTLDLDATTSYLAGVSVTGAVQLGSEFLGDIQTGGTAGTGDREFLRFEVVGEPVSYSFQLDTTSDGIETRTCGLIALTEAELGRISPTFETLFRERRSFSTSGVLEPGVYNFHVGAGLNFRFGKDDDGCSLSEELSFSATLVLGAPAP